MDDMRFYAVLIITLWEYSILICTYYNTHGKMLVSYKNQFLYVSKTFYSNVKDFVIKVDFQQKILSNYYWNLSLCGSNSINMHIRITNLM